MTEKLLKTALNPNQSIISRDFSYFCIDNFSHLLLICCMWERVKTYVVGTLKNCHNEPNYFQYTQHSIGIDIRRDIVGKALFTLPYLGLGTIVIAT